MIIGVDVSKSKLDAWMMKDPKDPEQTHLIVSNNEKGIKELIKKLKQFKVSVNDCLICYENTGIYSMPLAYSLDKEKIDNWVVNALEIRRAKGIARGKNDKTDSRDIALYAFTHRHKLILNVLPEKEIARLKVLLSEREKLMKCIKAMETTQEMKDFMPKEVIKELLTHNNKTVFFLKKQLLSIEREMQKLVNETKLMKQQFELLRSIPGVGPQTAYYLITKTKCFGGFENWRQLACYAGVAPFEYSSGSSIKGRTKVSHLADKKLKSLLNMCALTTKKVDKEIALYYERKTGEGKNPMLVMNNIRCKILSRVFAVISRGTPYVNLQKFAA